MGGKERDREREQEESSYYKRQSLPGAYDKGIASIEISQLTPKLLSQWEDQPATT